MTDCISEMSELLGKKRKLFELYEGETQKMMECGFSLMKDHVEKREGLKLMIDKIEEKMANCCKAEGKTGELIYNASKNRCDRGELFEEALSVFDRAQEIFIIINRIATYESQILNRIRENKSELEELIKASNNMPKIARYFDTMEHGFESGTFISRRKSRV